LNYGEPGHNALDDVLKPFMGAFDFREMEKDTNRLATIKDKERVLTIMKEISPANFVDAQDPPTLIVHGDADKLVPIQQAQLLMDKLKEAKVPCELVTKPGAAHGWANFQPDIKSFGDWFDKYLTKADVKSRQ
jgi:dipeptidyl aminopeptidase/acylaminoacyl peptidase